MRLRFDPHSLVASAPPPFLRHHIDAACATWKRNFIELLCDFTICHGLVRMPYRDIIDPESIEHSSIARAETLSVTDDSIKNVSIANRTKGFALQRSYASMAPNSGMKTSHSRIRVRPLGGILCVKQHAAAGVTEWRGERASTPSPPHLPKINRRQPQWRMHSDRRDQRHKSSHAD